MCGSTVVPLQCGTLSGGRTIGRKSRLPQSVGIATLIADDASERNPIIFDSQPQVGAIDS